MPGENDLLTVTPTDDGHVEVRFDQRVYRAPQEDVLIMPMNNISAENLATWVGRELRRRILDRNLATIKSR